MDLSPPKLRNQMLSQCFLKLRFVIIQGESVSENNQCLGGDLELRGHEDLSALLLHPGLRPQVLAQSWATKCLQVSKREPILWMWTGWCMLLWLSLSCRCSVDLSGGQLAWPGGPGVCDHWGCWVTGHGVSGRSPLLPERGPLQRGRGGLQGGQGLRHRAGVRGPGQLCGDVRSDPGPLGARGQMLSAALYTRQALLRGSGDYHWNENHDIAVAMSSSLADSVLGLNILQGWLEGFKYSNQNHCPGWEYLNV